MPEQNHPHVLVLGPLHIRREDTSTPITAPMERALLAILLVRSGEYVSSEWLIEALWQGNSPARAANTLQTYVGRLRKLLEPERQSSQPWQILRTEPQGYRLTLDATDCRRFDELSRRGLALLGEGDHQAAEPVLAQALTLWRGEDAFADVPDIACVRERADELHQQWTSVSKARWRAQLRCGRAHEVVGDIQPLLTRHPLDEELAELAMAALHQVGRTTQALQLYDTTARRLRDELGVDPGRALWEAHRQVLADSTPSTSAETTPVSHPQRAVNATTPAATSPTAAPTIVHHWKATALVTGALAVTAACAVAVVLNLSGAPNRALDINAERQPADNGFREVDLDLRAGFAHDLDVPPGHQTEMAIGMPTDSPDYARPDLYRTRTGPDFVGGWDPTRTDRYNRVEEVGWDADPAVCRELAPGAGGNVKVAEMRAGMRICVQTSEGRWAMLVVSELPPGRQGTMRAHAFVEDRASP